MTMNTNEPQHQMRAVDEIADAPDIDQLVIGADRRDSHLARRRVLMVLVCGAVAVICGVGVASTLARDNGNGSSPVRPTISSTADQGGRDLNDPTSSGAMTRTQAEILKVIEAKLPADLKVTAPTASGSHRLSPWPSRTRRAIPGLMRVSAPRARMSGTHVGLCGAVPSSG
jgi:hypothetical protein